MVFQRVFGYSLFLYPEALFIRKRLNHKTHNSPLIDGVVVGDIFFGI